MEVTGAECLPHTYQELLDYLGQLEYGATGGYRQWIYQTCTEFGWYQSSDQPGHPYGTKFPVDFSVKVNPKGSYTNFIDKILAFLTTYPPLLTFSTV